MSIRLAVASVLALSACGPLRANAAVSAPEPDLERDLHGIVVTTGGDPIPAALLRVVLPGARNVGGILDDEIDLDREVALGPSGPDGTFRFRLERWTAYDLFAEAEGFAPTKLPGRYAGEFVRAEVCRPAAITGVVVDAERGTPISGAIVEAEFDLERAPGSPRYQASTDEAGEYAILGLPRGLHVLSVRAPRHESRGDFVVSLEEAAQVRRDFVLVPTNTIRGTVTDGALKTPIPGATVRWRGKTEVFGVRTDGEGRYELPTLPDRGAAAVLSVSAQGYGDFQFSPGDMPEGRKEQDLFLLRGRRAYGRVVDGAGGPVRDACLLAGCGGYLYGAHQSERRLARSDGEGRFELVDLRQDRRHTLLVLAEGFAAAVFDFPEREWTQEEIDLGNLVLERPATLAGRLLDPTSQPLPGFWITLVGEPARRDILGPSLAGNEGYSGTLGFGRALARTDARGRYAFRGLPAGQYYLNGGAKGCARSARLEVSVGEGEILDSADLTLDVGLSLSGVVVDDAGEARPGASVRLYDGPDSRGQPLTYDFAKEGGRFSLRGLEARGYWVEADCQHYRLDDLSDETASPRQPVEAGTSRVRIVLPTAKGR